MCDSGTVLQSYGRCVVVRFWHVLLLTVLLDKSYTQLTLTIPGVQLSCTAHQIYLLFPLTSSHLCKTFSWFIMWKFLIQKHNIVKLSWIGNCLEYLLHVKKVMNHFIFHSSVIIDADLYAHAHFVVKSWYEVKNKTSWSQMWKQQIQIPLQDQWK